MKRNEIKKILQRIRGRNETRIELRIAYHQRKVDMIKVLDEKIRLLDSRDLLDEIELELGL